MKIYGVVEITALSIHTSELDTDEWSDSRPGHFISRNVTPIPIGQETRWA
jgi:hypothetical protein